MASASLAACLSLESKPEMPKLSTSCLARFRSNSGLLLAVVDEDVPGRVLRLDADAAAAFLDRWLSKTVALKVDSAFDRRSIALVGTMSRSLCVAIVRGAEAAMFGILLEVCFYFEE